MRQNPGESIGDYITRWRKKVAEMQQKPNEKEQIDMFIKTLHPSYADRLNTQDLLNFQAVSDVIDRMEGALREGRLTLPSQMSTTSTTNPKKGNGEKRSGSGQSKTVGSRVSTQMQFFL